MLCIRTYICTYVYVYTHAVDNCVCVLRVHDLCVLVCKLLPVRVRMCVLVCKLLPVRVRMCVLVCKLLPVRVRMCVLVCKLLPVCVRMCVLCLCMYDTI